MGFKIMEEIDKRGLELFQPWQPFVQDLYLIKGCDVTKEITVAFIYLFCFWTLLFLLDLLNFWVETNFYVFLKDKKRKSLYMNLFQGLVKHADNFVLQYRVCRLIRF